MASQVSEIENRGAKLFIVDPQERFRATNWKSGKRFPFTILSDPTSLVCGRYGVAKQIMVHEEWVNVPSAFVIDREGVIRFAKWGAGFSDRVTPQELLGAL